MQMHMCQCSECGRQFLAKRRGAHFCPDNSTCRVKSSRRAKAARMEAEKLQMPMDDFLIYQTIVGDNTTLQSYVASFMLKHGKEALHDMLVFTSAVTKER